MDLFLHFRSPDAEGSSAGKDSHQLADCFSPLKNYLRHHTSKSPFGEEKSCAFFRNLSPRHFCSPPVWHSVQEKSEYSASTCMKLWPFGFTWLSASPLPCARM